MALSLSKKCVSCVPVVSKALSSIETAMYVNMKKKSDIDSILRMQNSKSLVLGHPTHTCAQALRHLENSYDNVILVETNSTTRNSVTNAVDLFDVTIVPSRPKNSSFLEELDDAYLRGRNTIVVLNPDDPFHSVYFDTTVIGMIGAHKKIGVCKNIRLGRVQMVDWNPSWMLSQFVCSKIVI